MKVDDDWMVHNSHLPYYRRPFGAVVCREAIVLMLAVAAQRCPVRVVVRLWMRGTGETILPMTPAGERGGMLLWRTEAEMPAAPGVVWYYFIVTTGDGVYYYGSPDGLGGQGQVSREPPQSYQITVYRRGTKTPDWFKDAVMYQIFVDRFANGASDGRALNPRPGCLLHASWNDTPFYTRDVKTGAIEAYDFFGGNLAGVMKKLPYLKDLGIRVIYLNPVFESPSNHKYDTADYLHIDRMFGDNETFAALCRAAKAAGITVILDGVFSHTGADSIYFNKQGNYPGPGAYQSPDSPYYPWYRFRAYPDEYESWWGIDALPNVEELAPSYLDFMVEGQDSVVRTWLAQGAKGWRLDVADELPDEFIRRIRRVMKTADPESILIGEVWEDASRKESYGKLREYLLGDELDSVMSYPFRTMLVDFILGVRTAEQTGRALLSLSENYPPEHFYAAMNLLGTHDVPRILTVLGEAPPAEDMTDSEQARYRLDAAQRRLATDRLKLLVLWQMTFPGVPCLYYGDEAGLEGYGDPFNRGTYPWGHEDGELLNWYRTVIALRNRHAVLRTGEWAPLYAGGDVFGYIRVIRGGRDVFDRPADDNAAVVLFNRGRTETATVTVDMEPWPVEELTDVLAGGPAQLTDGVLTVSVGPLAGKILLAKNEYPADRRRTGILLHPTCLPGMGGIGAAGPQAYAFVDKLAEKGYSLWQVLPLHPVGYGESPYQALSAFAGNPLLIAPEGLQDMGLLTAAEVMAAAAEPFPADTVDFPRAAVLKERLCRLAFSRFHPTPDYDGFRTENAGWLEDYILYAAIKKECGGVAWNRWDERLARRDATALAACRQRLQGEMEYQSFLQYLFFRQWCGLKAYANKKGIRIVGDMPLFVAYDSADVWANPGLFALDDRGDPVGVAGVPPDYFSATGQLWGNPHYRWDKMAADDYRWWRERFRQLLQMADIIRLDHFRGFEAYWEVPPGEKTAVNGRWVKGPGARFFRTMRRYLGDIPLIAEDLGVITPEVELLKDRFGFPGMKILQFAFGRDQDGASPVFTRHSVVYTGTHDNDTIVGWYLDIAANDPELAAGVERHVGVRRDMAPREMAARFRDYALATPAQTVIFPLQDVLGLDGRWRMNRPGTAAGNWRVRIGALAAILR